MEGETLSNCQILSYQLLEKHKVKNNFSTLLSLLYLSFSKACIF